MRVWGRRNSVCTQRVLWCADEAGIDAELTLASAIYGPEGHVWRGSKPFGVVDTPDYLAMNPNGTVPTINDNGAVVWESNAILSYLALRYAPWLFESDPVTFGRASSWGGWCNSKFSSPLGKATQHLFRLPPGERDPAALRTAVIEMDPILDILERTLASSRYLAGDGLTIADIAVAPFVQRWYWYELERPGVPAVDAWLARLSDRPGYRRHVFVRDYHIDSDARGTEQT